MPKQNLAVVILAAGHGKRMKSDIPKVMHTIAGKPMVRYVVDMAEGLNPEKVIVVVAPDDQLVTETVAPHRTVVQETRMGTGHATLCARDTLKSFAGDVLVVFGDSPFLTTGTIERMMEARRQVPKPSVVVLGFRPQDPTGYGRLILDKKQNLDAIVEHRDASEDQRKINLCNSGVFLVEGTKLFGLLERVKNDNSQGEYYLVDIVKIARSDKLTCAVVEAPVEELIGVNSREELAYAEEIAQKKLRAQAMSAGATLIGQNTIFLSHDTKLGEDVTVGPYVVFGSGVKIGKGCEIRSFSHIEGAIVADNAIVGPFARLRPGAEIGEQAHIGNFCEIKKANIERGAKVNHLSYIGDARVGAGTNIGAGTITCNYDGFVKSFTDIGAGAFIGSNTALVAPVKIGDNAIVGAGSTITSDVAAGDLSVARAEQNNIAKGAEKFKSKRKKKAS